MTIIMHSSVECENTCVNPGDMQGVYNKSRYICKNRRCHIYSLRGTLFTGEVCPRGTIFTSE